MQVVFCVLGNFIPVADITVPGCERVGGVLCRHNAVSNGSTQSPHTDSTRLGKQFPTRISETDGRGRLMGV